MKVKVEMVINVDESYSKEEIIKLVNFEWEANQSVSCEFADGVAYSVLESKFEIIEGE